MRHGREELVLEAVGFFGGLPRPLFGVSASLCVLMSMQTPIMDVG